MSGYKIAVWSLVSLLAIRLLHSLWQRVCIARTGEPFQFLLTSFRPPKEASWKDVRYSLAVVVDSALLVFVLAWVWGRIS